MPLKVLKYKVVVLNKHFCVFFKRLFIEFYKERMGEGEIKHQ